MTASNEPKAGLTLLLLFSISLFVAVLLSGWARKTILSTAVLFLAAGLLVGSGAIPRSGAPGLPTLRILSEVALFSTLFSDGIRTQGYSTIRGEWHLAGRALLIGMPLTIGAIALVGHFAARMNWLVALLLGAALSPTDPVFVSAIFHINSVPERIKRALNVESGLNDGLALTALTVLLSVQEGRHGGVSSVAFELALGVAIGIVIPWIGIKVEETGLFEAVGLFEPLLAFSLGLLVFAICVISGANEFLAAFSAGVTIASISRRASQAFTPFGEVISELLKLAALMAFGAIIAKRLFTPLSWQEYLFITLSIFAVRPAVTFLAWLGVDVTKRELLTFGWFGPKGFASVIYGIMLFQAGLFHAAHLVALAVIVSIVVFSSTDILVGRTFKKHQSPPNEAPPQSGTPKAA